ncbi:MAG: hypothetical protein ACJ74J_04425 [Blastocatellia bacterium]
MNLGRHFNACTDHRHRCGVASATLESAGIQASLTRRDHRAVDFQALKRLAKLNRRYAAVSQALKCLAKLIRRYAARTHRR